MAKKHEEAKHGADWEWWLIHNNEGLRFRIQAKRLFQSGQYQSLFDKKKGAKPYDQLNKLAAASKKENCIPLYCFYNFPVRNSQFSARKKSCRHRYKAPSFWGCSIALPEAVRAKNPTN